MQVEATAWQQHLVLLRILAGPWAVQARAQRRARTDLRRQSMPQCKQTPLLMMRMADLLGPGKTASAATLPALLR